MIAKGLMIAGKAEHIANPESVGPENVTLGGDSVAVSGNHLHDRFQTVAQQNRAGCDARHAHHRCLIVSDVCRVNAAPDEVYLILQMHHVCAPGRAALAGYGEMTGTEHTLKVASRFDNVFIAHGPRSLMWIVLVQPGGGRLAGGLSRSLKPLAAPLLCYFSL
jgi:hypothetical protein